MANCMCGHPTEMHNADTGSCRMCNCDDCRLDPSEQRLRWEYRQVGELDQIRLGVSEVWYAWHGDNLYMITLSTIQDIGYDVTFSSPCGHTVYLGWGPCIEYAKGLVEIFVDYTASKQNIRDDLDLPATPAPSIDAEAAIAEVRLVREKE